MPITRRVVVSGCGVKSDTAGEYAPTPTVAATPVAYPSAAKQAKNFGRAMVRHVAAGAKLRSEEEIEQLLAICQACPFLDEQQHRCVQCGCPTNARRHWRNKLAIATERCPIGRW